ncbi:hypothetical protein ACH3XW_50485 [Acanthocheilonema viteae]
MPTGKKQDKHDNYKKLPNKYFLHLQWEDRLSNNGEEDDGDITDPELIAEKEYALEHGTEFDMNFIGRGGLSMAAGDGGGLSVAAGGGAGPRSFNKEKKDALISARIKQAKADRKARGRGVSGSMCKKNKDIAYGGFHTLMDMDVYYGLDDEYDTHMSDAEEPFADREDDYEDDACEGKVKADQSNVDLINEDMNQMSLNDDDEQEDDDRPGPSRSYHGTNDDGKPKRLYRM